MTDPMEILRQSPRPESREAKKLGCSCVETRVTNLDGSTRREYTLQAGCPVHGLEALPEFWAAVDQAQQEAVQGQAEPQPQAAPADSQPKQVKSGSNGNQHSGFEFYGPGNVH